MSCVNIKKKKEYLTSMNELNSCYKNLNLNGDECLFKKTNLQFKDYDKPSKNIGEVFSLHIKPYEDSVEYPLRESIVQKKKPKWKTVKDFFKKRFDTGAYEYPRQQANDSSIPEIMDFHPNQQLFNPSDVNSTPRGRPKNTITRKSRLSATRSAAAVKRFSSSIVDSMTPSQQNVYNLSIARGDKMEQELLHEKNVTEELTRELEKEKSVSNELREKLMEVTNEMKNERKDKIELLKQVQEQKMNFNQLELQYQELEKLSNKKTNELVQKSNDLAASQKTCIQLKSALNEMLSNYRTIRLEVGSLKDDIKKLQEKNVDLMNELATAIRSKETALAKVTKYRLSKRMQKSKQRYVPYPAASERTQRRRIENIVKEVEQLPLIKEKVIARVTSKSIVENKKLSSVQAIAMAVELGFNQNQLEKMKTFLRLFDMDILPPVSSMRKTLFKIKSTIDYENFHDEKLDIYGRRILSVSYGLKHRTEMLWESGQFVEIPGFEDYVFYALTADFIFFIFFLVMAAF